MANGKWLLQEEIVSRGQDIEDRLIRFAVRVVKLCDEMKHSRARNHVAGQLLRSGTAPAAHYAEARNAESHKDFVHKMRLGLKELNESRIWLQILMDAELVAAGRLQNLHKECQELCRIFGASIATTKSKQSQK